jgi:hypothetical protein
MSLVTYLNWKQKYDGLLPTEMLRLKLDTSKNPSPNRRAIDALSHVTTGMGMWRIGLGVSLMFMSGSRRFPQRAMAGSRKPRGSPKRTWMRAGWSNTQRPSSMMPERTRISNARKSRVRSAVEHVFAHQKFLMGLVLRSIGIARATVKVGMANLAYNMRRFVWLSGRYAAA